MPSVARRTRGLLAGVLTISLAGAALTGAVPSASAAPAFDAELRVEGYYDIDGPVTCTVTAGGPETAAATFTTSGGRTRTVSSEATVTDSADAGDVSQLATTATATGKVTAKAGNLSTLDISARASASAVATQGPAMSVCDVAAEADASLTIEFTLTRPGWLDLTVTKSVAPGAVVYFIVSPTNGLIQEVVDGHKVRHTRTVFLPAGDYTFAGVLTAERATDTAATDGSVASAANVHAAFTPAGGAVGPARGTGRRYLTPATERVCGTGALAARWTARAGKVRSSAFFVNQRRVKTVRNPRAGTTVTVQGLPARKPISLVVVHTLKSGRTSQVSTSYRACS